MHGSMDWLSGIVAIFQYWIICSTVILVLACAGMGYILYKIWKDEDARDN